MGADPPWVTACIPFANATRVGGVPHTPQYPRSGRRLGGRMYAVCKSDTLCSGGGGGCIWGLPVAV
jgi:hypothetical protein